MTDRTPPVRQRRAGRAAVALAGAAGLVATGSPVLAAPEAIDVSAFCAAAPQAPGFTDAAGPFAAQIACLAATGITRGVTPTTFAPGGTVTRGQMASFVVRLVDTSVALQSVELNELPEGGGAAFRDVPPDTPHFEAVNRLADAGIVQGGAGGRPTDEFAPAVPVSRAQTATMLAGAYAWLTGDEIGTASDVFTDVAGLDPQVRADINVLASAGVTRGVGGDRFAPAEGVRRGQMAAFLTRLLAVLHDRELVGPLTPSRFAPTST